MHESSTLEKEKQRLGMPVVVMAGSIVVVVAKEDVPSAGEPLWRSSASVRVPVVLSTKG